MDRKVDSKQLKRERLTLIAKVATSIAIIIAIALVLAHYFRPQVKSSEIRLASVERGDIEITVSASGKVSPAAEQTIVSPINTTILEVYKHSGDSVVEGEAILRLDLGQVESELAQMKREQEMAQLQLSQLKLQNRSKLSEAKMNIEVQKVEQEQRVEQLRAEEYLDSLGAGTPERVREMRVAVKLGELKLKESEGQAKNRKALTASDEAVKQLELDILNQNIEQKQKIVNEAQLRAPRTATLSFVSEQVGEQVSAGSKVAMLSDVSTFKIDGKISNNYADRVSIGSEVIARVDRTKLRGTVSNINPIAVDNSISLTVQLKDNNNPILRSGIVCDLYIVESRIENTLKIPSGNYYIGAGDYTIFILEGEFLRPRAVKLGKGSFDYVEVIDGLQEGERVVTSDISKFKNKREVKYKTK